MRFIVVVLFVIAVVGSVGCAGSSDAGGKGDGSVAMGCAQINSAFLTCMACHTTVSADASGGGFDMQKTGWEKSLIGKSTPADAPDTALCKGKNLVLLEPNVEPAKGLFLDKLNQATPPCGDRMPKLLDPLSSSQLACVQAWANSIVAGGTGQ